MELAIQWELSEIINKMITKLENREKNNSYQREYYNNNKQIFKKAIKKYQQSEKGKKTIGRYYRSEKFKEINNRCHSKRRQKILKRREEEDVPQPRRRGRGSKPRLNFTLNVENIYYCSFIIYFSKTIFSGTQLQSNNKY